MRINIFTDLCQPEIFLHMKPGKQYQETKTVDGNGHPEPDQVN
jgi:hypothetical protein